MKPPPFRATVPSTGVSNRAGLLTLVAECPRETLHLSDLVDDVKPCPARLEERQDQALEPLAHRRRNAPRGHRPRSGCATARRCRPSRVLIVKPTRSPDSRISAVKNPDAVTPAGSLSRTFRINVVFPVPGSPVTKRFFFKVSFPFLRHVKGGFQFSQRDYIIIVSIVQKEGTLWRSRAVPSAAVR